MRTAQVTIAPSDLLDEPVAKPQVIRQQEDRVFVSQQHFRSLGTADAQLPSRDLGHHREHEKRTDSTHQQSL